MDCGGRDKEYYAQKLDEMKLLYKSSYIEMKNGKFPYALRDIRVGIEKGVKCIIEHYKGSKYYESNLYKNIEICSRHALIEDDFIRKLHSSKDHCNDSQHDNDIEKTYDQVHFTHKVLEEVMVVIKAIAS